MENRGGGEGAGPKIIPPHGGYRDLRPYRMAEIAHDGTVAFCGRFIDARSRTKADGPGGKKREAEYRRGKHGFRRVQENGLKLVGAARAGLEELLLDFQDYLRQHGLPLWGKIHPRAGKARGLSHQKNRPNLTYEPYIEAPAGAETAANALICLIHQANCLPDQQLRSLERRFPREGGLTGKLYKARQQACDSGRKP